MGSDHPLGGCDSKYRKFRKAQKRRPLRHTFNLHDHEGPSSSPALPLLAYRCSSLLIAMQSTTTSDEAGGGACGGGGDVCVSGPPRAPLRSRCSREKASLLALESCPTISRLCQILFCFDTFLDESLEILRSLETHLPRDPPPVADQCSTDSASSYATEMRAMRLLQLDLKKI